MLAFAFLIHHCPLLHIPMEISSPSSELPKLVHITFKIIVYHILPNIRLIYAYNSPAVPYCNYLEASTHAYWVSISLKYMVKIRYVTHLKTQDFFKIIHFTQLQKPGTNISWWFPHLHFHLTFSPYTYILNCYD